MLHRVEEPPVVVLDANVLVPNALRDTLLRAAEAGLYEVRWSTTTLHEVERTLLTKILVRQVDRDARVGRLTRAMRSSFPNATVIEDAAEFDQFAISPSDRHVLAAALRSGAGIIVTNNLRHFPRSALAPHGVVARSLDEFLLGLLHRNAGLLLALLTVQGTQLRQPRDLGQVLATLAQHVPRFVEAVRATLAARP